MCSSLLFRSRNLAVFYLVCVSVTNCFVRVKIFSGFPLRGRPLLCFGKFSLRYTSWVGLGNSGWLGVLLVCFVG